VEGWFSNYNSFGLRFINVGKVKTLFKIENILVFLILLPAIFLRFYNLGYSDYHGDEHKAFIQLEPGQSLFSFFMAQRKGPLQFVVSYLPYLFTHNFKNELAERLPFALVSVISLLIFYKLIKKITLKTSIALYATALLAFDGFIVGFGRIAQYQNLNLLFSFLSLYYFYDISVKIPDIIPEKIKKSAILGTICFCLSFLSHWDAVYILPVIIYFLAVFLSNKNIQKTQKISIIKQIILYGTVILLPFMVPYTYFLYLSQENQRYFNRRVSLGIFDIKYYKFLIDLYNPYITFWFLSLFGLIGIVSIKKSIPFVIWFLFTFIVFTCFFSKPGTHIYNFVIPGIVLCAIGMDNIASNSPKYLRWLHYLLFTLTFMFFFYQSYRYFVDTSAEYPFDQKNLFTVDPNIIKTSSTGYSGTIVKIISQESPEYSLEQKLPLFGFVHARYWKEINAFVNSENIKNNENCGYVTNEDKVISDWYMDAKYANTGCFYAVGIKNPMNFVKDWSFPQYPQKSLVKTFRNKQVVVKIYKSIQKVKDSNPVTILTN
jgi:hypothetical protein